MLQRNVLHDNLPRRCWFACWVPSQEDTNTARTLVVLSSRISASTLSKTLRLFFYKHIMYLQLLSINTYSHMLSPEVPRRNQVVFRVQVSV